MRTGTAAVNWLLGDHLGSTALTADSAGAKLAEVRYKAWGEQRYTSTGTTPTTYRYTGQREEAGLGLYFYGARWYDPAIGRFLQADTIVPEASNPQTLNRYTYTRGNPLKYTDPSGHDGVPTNQELLQQALQYFQSLGWTVVGAIYYPYLRTEAEMN